jgi:hypothetical protein
MRKDICTAVLILLLIAFPSQSRAAGNTFDVNSDAQIDLRYDYSLDIIINNSNYLSYPNSTLKPLTQLQITYRINPRFKTIPNAGQHLPYEELWYHIDQVVGSRRLSALNIPASLQGVIRVVPSSIDSSNDKPVANAILRLFLDLSLIKCSINDAFVPTDIFQPVVNDMPDNHFLLNPPPPPANPTLRTLQLTIDSNPMGSFHTVYYKP